MLETHRYGRHIRQLASEVRFSSISEPPLTEPRVSDRQGTGAENGRQLPRKSQSQSQFQCDCCFCCCCRCSLLRSARKTFAQAGSLASTLDCSDLEPAISHRPCSDHHPSSSPTSSRSVVPKRTHTQCRDQQLALTQLRSFPLRACTHSVALPQPLPISEPDRSKQAWERFCSSLPPIADHFP